MNNLKNKLLDFKRRLSDRHIYSIVITALAIVSTIALYHYRQALDYQAQVELQYQRAFSEVVGFVGNVDVSLQKMQLSGTPRQLALVSAEARRYCIEANANLGQIPSVNDDLSKAAKFLTQAGDYSNMISNKALSGNMPNEQENKQIEDLSIAASNLSNKLAALERDIYSGVIRFGSFEQLRDRTENQENGEPVLDGDNYAYPVNANMDENSKNTENKKDNPDDMQNEPAEYPMLVYDGPFSDHLDKIEPEYIKDMPEVSKEDAMEVVRNFVGGEKNIDVNYEGEDNGKIPCFSYSVKFENEITNFAVTKKGGKILWFLNGRSVENSNLNMDEAIEKANEVFPRLGLDSMSYSYYVTDHNIATVNFAKIQNGIILYPDLIKVRVAMDNGEILGIESRGFIMCNRNRDLGKPVITESQARQKVNSKLDIEKVRMAVIPKPGGLESFCYEFKGNHKGKNFLIYVDAMTGTEENILLLIQSDNGILTI